MIKINYITSIYGKNIIVFTHIMLADIFWLTTIKIVLLSTYQ